MRMNASDDPTRPTNAEYLRSIMPSTIRVGLTHAEWWEKLYADLATAARADRQLYTFEMNEAEFAERHPSIIERLVNDGFSVSYSGVDKWTPQVTMRVSWH